MVNVMVGWLGGWLAGGGGVPMLFKICFFLFASYFFFVSPRILSSSFFLAREDGGFLRFSLHENCAFPIAF